jgi:ABC-type microcin C transport system permease subunit YejB
MRERLAGILGEEAAGELWVSTFHSMCVKILRREHAIVGLPKSFSIVDAEGHIASVTQTVNLPYGNAMVIPGTGFLLNSAIFQRDLPLLQGTILVLAMFFVLLNLIVDVVQSLLDPRIARG